MDKRGELLKRPLLQVLVAIVIALLIIAGLFFAFRKVLAPYLP